VVRRTRAEGAAVSGTASGSVSGTVSGTGLGDLLESAGLIRQNVERVIEGKPEVVRLALVVLLAEGHLLIEDVPGVGKTMLAKALARSLDCSVKRIQFTPDLLPSDVTGVSVYDLQTRAFEFKPGAVFANLVVGDEINRASPKTQSALLEAMEERQVTVDGTTYVLEAPFMVVATQNPIEMEGTYPLPEAQRDRFTARVSMGYPSPEAERDMLDTHGGPAALDELEPVADAFTVRKLIEIVRGIHVSDEVKQYVVDLVTATRQAPELRLGASPRASLQLLRASRAAAGLDGRDYVLPDDVQGLASSVLAHRLLPTAEAQVARRSTESVVEELIARLPLPTVTARR
jgi:MoxR-like ATPase